jgi:hypothetical protein
LQLGQAAEDSDYCTQFALKIFDKAEKQDRDGRATAATSKAYYAASVFLEVRAPGYSCLRKGQRNFLHRADLC